MIIKIKFNMRRDGLDRMDLYDDFAEEMEKYLSTAEVESILKLSDDEVIIDTNDSIITYTRFYMEDIDNSKLRTIIIRLSNDKLEDDILLTVDRERYRYSGFAAID